MPNKQLTKRVHCNFFLYMAYRKRTRRVWGLLCTIFYVDMPCSVLLKTVVFTSLELDLP